MKLSSNYTKILLYKTLHGTFLNSTLYPSIQNKRQILHLVFRHQPSFPCQKVNPAIAQTISTIELSTHHLTIHSWPSSSWGLFSDISTPSLGSMTTAVHHLPRRPRQSILPISSAHIIYYLGWCSCSVPDSSLNSKYRIGDLTSHTRELRFNDHEVRRCSGQHFREDVLWWSSRVRGGSILPRTILGHRCDDKGWSSGTTSSSLFLSLRNLTSHKWKWNSRKGKCKHLGSNLAGSWSITAM